MNGGTSANALGIYEAQAKEFTGYWAGTQDLDTTMKNITASMTELLKK
jgi:multiple sugar transport system substrate-binding protein